MKTPYFLFALMRKMFVFSGGVTNDLISFFISLFRPFKIYKNHFSGILGTLSISEIDKIVKNIEEKGYHTFPVKLDSRLVDDLVNFANSSPCVPCGEKEPAYFNVNDPYPRFDFKPDDLLKNDTVCDLVTDETLRVVAGRYLKATPICDLVAMWWSLPSKIKTSEAAQMYHFDMDRFKFLKFFFYLTDVSETTGPHCFVEASHRTLPFSLRRDGRFCDDEIEKYYGRNSIRKFTGPSGTILAVDTRGFHKGEKLNDGKRLLFQIEFSNSLFGMNYELLNRSSISASRREKFDNLPETYLRIFNQ